MVVLAYQRALEGGAENLRTKMKEAAMRVIETVEIEISSMKYQQCWRREKKAKMKDGGAVYLSKKKKK